MPADQAERIDRYVAGLQAKLVTLIGAALADLKPARLAYSHARAGFAMNRRLPTPKGYQNSPYPDGPVDHAVPVLQYLEEARPGTKALFVMGCGGDQNPYPRGQLEQAQQHGRALANAVETALLPQAKPVRGPMRVVLDEVTLEFVPPAGRDELLKLKESQDPRDRRRAERFLDELDKTGRIRSTYEYPIQVVRFGDDLMLLALAGEVVVDYALRFKRELADTPLWVAGYSNDVFGYVPSLRVLKEGGYEAGGAMRFTRLPGPFAPSVEERIVGKVHELVKRVRAKD
jgi:hypothetical protein